VNIRGLARSDAAFPNAHSGMAETEVRCLAGYQLAHQRITGAGQALEITTSRYSSPIPRAVPKRAVRPRRRWHPKPAADAKLAVRPRRRRRAIPDAIRGADPKQRRRTAAGPDATRGADPKQRTVAGPHATRSGPDGRRPSASAGYLKSGRRSGSLLESHSALPKPQSK